MNVTRRGALVLVGVFAAGSVSGHLFTDCPSTQPEEVVTAPSPEPTASPTPTPVATPLEVTLPDSCLAALATLEQAEAFSAVVSKTSGKHVLNMSDAGVAMVDKDQQLLNKIIQREIYLKDTTDEAATQLEATQLTLDRQVEQCKTDSADAS